MVSLLGMVWDQAVNLGIGSLGCVRDGCPSLREMQMPLSRKRPRAGGPSLVPQGRNWIGRLTGLHPRRQRRNSATAAMPPSVPAPGGIHLHPWKRRCCTRPAFAVFLANRSATRSQDSLLCRWYGAAWKMRNIDMICSGRMRACTPCSGTAGMAAAGGLLRCCAFYDSWMRGCVCFEGFQCGSLESWWGGPVLPHWRPGQALPLTAEASAAFAKRETKSFALRLATAATHAHPAA